ncbi:MAG TPA: SRPBCC family protein [Candidatus Hydrogenedentes bacterium]|nr:SRPBCC family protein [Candidatus Hydrogenedentota bacterium]
MRVHRLKQEQIVARPIDEVFSFFARPENLERITPAQLRFHILTPSPIRMGAGAVIDYELRIWGVPVHWRTLITDFEPPYQFIDQQLKGPYAMWHHRHTFEAVEGGTRIGDEVTYALPFGPLGTLVHGLYVRHDIGRIFEHRKKVIASHFREGAPMPDSPQLGVA